MVGLAIYIVDRFAVKRCRKREEKKFGVNEADEGWWGGNVERVEGMGRGRERGRERGWMMDGVLGNCEIARCVLIYL